MPGEHAVLSPSSSDRWLQCPASVRLAEKMPKGPDSVYAAEGTNAHTMGEIEASYAFGKITKRQRTIRLNRLIKDAGLTDADVTEMQEHVDKYVSVIQERASLYPHSEVLFEQRMDTGVPTSWGTSDTVIVSPRHVEIIDLKYGKGVRVEAADNSQLRLYALGALDTFGDLLGETEFVRMTVHQPRLSGEPSTEELTATELRAWRDSIIPIAKEALSDNARFGPSESACRWCPAAGDCRARMEYMTRLDFGQDPDLISSEELADLLGSLADVSAWVSAVEASALRRGYSEGEHIPGWKVVLSGGRRVIKDTEGALQAFTRAGYEREDVLAPEKLLGVTALDKVLKPHGDSLRDVLGDLLTHTEGKPAMAPEADKRPAIDRNSVAAQEFTEGGDSDLD